MPDRAATLLIVEDEEPNRALLRAILSRSADPDIRAAILLEAPDLATAREHLMARPVDVMILDVRLPDGNGLDLARELMESGVAQRPRILVLSASVLPGERAAALAAGSDAFLSKPFDLTALVATLGGLIRGDGTAA